jgi:hypothetical protein
MNYETKMSNPETGRMFDQLADLIRETIEVPNKMLPARFRDNRKDKNGGRSLAELEKMIWEEEQAESEYRKLKRIKAENAANYRKQVEESGEFVYNGQVDEIGLYEKEQRFVGLAIEAGWVEDLEVVLLYWTMFIVMAYYYGKKPLRRRKRERA